jgi:hypothetical protein
MNDTDPQKTERYALILVNFSQGPDMHQIRTYPNDMPFDSLQGMNLGNHKVIYIKSIDQLAAIIARRYEKTGELPQIKSYY